MLAMYARRARVLPAQKVRAGVRTIPCANAAAAVATPPPPLCLLAPCVQTAGTLHTGTTLADVLRHAYQLLRVAPSMQEQRGRHARAQTQNTKQISEVTR